MRCLTTSGCVRVVLALAALLGLVAVRTRSADAGRPTPMAVVVSANCPLANLSLYQLKHLYLGEYVSGPDGQRLVPLNRTPPERVVFDSAVLSMTADEVAAYWIDRRIRGERGSPRAMPSGEVALRMVAHLEGAVTYVRTDEVRPGVKVVRIDGKLPTDPGYSVR